MKKIEAIFPEEKLDTVKDQLEAQGFIGKTIYHVKGRGQKGGILLQWRAGTYRVDFLPKIMMMIVVPDEDCAKVVDIIQTACQMDVDPKDLEMEYSPHYGKIFVSTIDEIYSLKPTRADFQDKP